LYIYVDENFKPQKDKKFGEPKDWGIVTRPPLTPKGRRQGAHESYTNAVIAEPDGERV